MPPSSIFSLEIALVDVSEIRLPVQRLLALRTELQGLPSTWGDRP